MGFSLAKESEQNTIDLLQISDSTIKVLRSDKHWGGTNLQTDRGVELGLDQTKICFQTDTLSFVSAIIHFNTNQAFLFYSPFNPFHQFVRQDALQSCLIRLNEI